MFGNPEKIFPIMVGTWIVLGLLSFYLFFIRKNYEFKVRYFKYFVIMVAILFIAFVTAMGAPLQAYIFMIPVVIVITFLNIRNTRFCKTCGKTIINQLGSGKIDFCPKCGSKLQD